MSAISHHDARRSGAVPEVTLRGVSKRFGRVVAVDGVDLEVPRGETIAVLGRNGAGKTTTLRLALGLLHPDEGTVEVRGDAPRRAVEEGRIGAMLQDGGLTTGVTVREMVEFVRVLHGRGRDPGAVLEMVGLHEAADRLVTRLSGGQAQRLRLALALVGEPELLVLDEPTAGMDVEARQMFWSNMQAQARAGRTIVFSTHYLKEADDAADRVVILAGGRVVADGPTERIKDAAGGRVVRFGVDGLGRDAAPDDALRALPGVSAVDVQDGMATLRSSDADATVKRLLSEYPDVHRLEVRSVDLEEAFVALTSGAPAEMASSKEVGR